MIDSIYCGPMGISRATLVRPVRGTGQIGDPQGPTSEVFLVVPA
jgi:hypothetical protein